MKKIIKKHRKKIIVIAVIIIVVFIVGVIASTVFAGKKVVHPLQLDGLSQ